ncbi:MAG: TIGR00282 family metallophosphoesterase [Candidatus Latescibacteria bacterium]|nr:TIGR00282 family metallophosphoesterase [Candidatus Latescibacterota bacterium]
MKILFVGDLYGKPGRRAAAELVPNLIERREIDLCVVNGENVAGGFGITENLARKIKSYGAHVITLGNHVWDRKDTIPFIVKSKDILRPANFPPGVGGAGSCVVISRKGYPAGVVSLQGRTHMRDLDCPFRVGQQIVHELRRQTPVILVDFHAEATSEKVAFAHYLDGQVSAVIGTHTHVQTSDERVLSGGTAFITDVGMTGPQDSVIGARKAEAIQRFLTQMSVRLEVATGDVQLCAVVIDVDEATGRARGIERLRIPYAGDVSGPDDDKDE